MIKFPRTPHIYNLGSATRDDLLLSEDTINKFLSSEITIEEKVDGANLAIKLDENYKPICWNRSKYVDHMAATQFKSLDKFLIDYSADLYEILKSDDNDERILYGEWLYAKHTINYDRLPCYFIAFDLFSVTQNKFYSREKFNEIVKQTSIPTIKVIFSGIIESKNKLLELMKVKSEYYDGPIEGLYLRIDNDDYLESRSKLVSAEFHQEIEDSGHWSKKMLVTNKVMID